MTISNYGVVLQRPNESITLSDYVMILYAAGLPSGNKDTLVKTPFPREHDFDTKFRVAVQLETTWDISAITLGAQEL